MKAFVDTKYIHIYKYEGIKLKFSKFILSNKMLINVPCILHFIGYGKYT